MESKLNKKLVLIISLGLAVWLAGILVTPVLASNNWPLGRKVAAFMYFFYKPVCHQIPGRSFCLDGFTLAVCVRCFSFYLGGLFITLACLFKGKIRLWPLTTYILMAAPAFLDFVLEKFNLYTNIDLLRLVTGLLLGIAVFHLLLVSFSTSTTKQQTEMLTK